MGELSNRFGELFFWCWEMQFGIGDGRFRNKVSRSFFQRVYSSKVTTKNPNRKERIVFQASFFRGELLNFEGYFQVYRYPLRKNRFTRKLRGRQMLWLERRETLAEMKLDFTISVVFWPENQMAPVSSIEKCRGNTKFKVTHSGSTNIAGWKMDPD